MNKSVSTSELAAILRIGAERVRQLEQKGVLKRTGHGKYDLKASLHGYIDFRIEAEKRQAAKTASVSRIAELKAQQLELRVAKARGELMLVAESQAIIEEAAGVYLTALGSLPAKISDDPKERDRIDDIIFELRSELAKKFEELADQAEAAGEKQ